MRFISRRNFVTFFLVAVSFGLSEAETIVIKGSDTLGAKLLPQLAEGFRAAYRDQSRSISFEIAAEGSSTGVAAVMESSADIGMLSRELDPQDRVMAQTKGIAPVTIEIARDGLVVILNEANPIDTLSSEEVRSIFTGEIKNWAALSLFAGDISVYTRGTASGSYGAFQTIALKSRNYSEFSQKLAGNEQIAAEVAGNPNAIGYVGIAYTKREGIKILEIDGTMPESPAYPYARPLYFLIDANRTLPDDVRKFITFTLSEEGQSIIQRAGFLPRLEDAQEPTPYVQTIDT